MKTKLSIVALWSFMLFSCSKEDSTTPTPVLPLPNPDGKVHYTDIAPIINSNCTGCHGATPSNGAPMSLTTLNNVKDAIQNRGLLDRISRAQGTPGMMPNGGTRLPQASIDKITKWQTDGFLN